MMVAGLGNPGRRYGQNRHNVGFLFLDHLAGSSRTDAPFRYKSAFDAEVAECRIAGERVWLVKPQSYMNLSGSPVSRVAAYYKVDPSRVIVVYDDVALPFGEIRVRPQGSAGGHNGMKSVIQELGTEAFPRIRVGIAAPRGGRDLSAHVLSDFSGEEQKALPDLLERCREALELVVGGRIDQAMARFNRRVADEAQTPSGKPGGDEQR